MILVSLNFLRDTWATPVAHTDRARVSGPSVPDRLVPTADGPKGPSLSYVPSSVRSTYRLSTVRLLPATVHTTPPSEGGGEGEAPLSWVLLVSSRCPSSRCPCLGWTPFWTTHVTRASFVGHGRPSRLSSTVSAPWLVRFRPQGPLLQVLPQKYSETRTGIRNCSFCLLNASFV